MNILVTGAAGFVGGHLIKELTDNGHTVVAAVNNTEKTPGNSEVVKADLMQPAEVKRINFKVVDAVIHLAGLAAVGPSYDNPDLYMRVNRGIQTNLYEACIEQDARPRFIIASSGTVYDPKAPMPLTEESKVDPTSSPYAKSKLAQEELALEYDKKGFESIPTRPFNHIGRGQGLGFLAPDLAQQFAAAKRGEITEIKVGNLAARRDYTDVDDIVRAYRLLAESPIKGEIFNICSGTSISGEEILDLFVKISRMARLAITQDPARMRPSDNPVIIGDHSKITNATGWEPIIPLEQTLRDVLDDWYTR